MRRILPGLACILVTLSACASPEPSPETAPAPPTTQPAPVLPAATHPEASTAEECPYLSTQWLADTNGQRVTRTGTDPRFDPPACIFWSYPPEPQAEILVRTMPDEAQARGVVDAFLPVSDSALAELPGGWSGGRTGGEGHGAAFGVARGPHAVVVLTNQEQSFKAQLIAEHVIANLQL